MGADDTPMTQGPVPAPEKPEVPVVLERLAQGLTIIGSATLALMMVHICADVVLKFVLSKPLSGTLEIVSGYYMVITIFAPLALVELRREAIVVDAFFNYFSRSIKYICIIISLVLAIVVFAAFAYQSGLDALHAFRIGERAMGTAETPIWPARIIMPVSFTLAALVSLAQLVAHLQGRNPELAPNHTDDVIIREL